MGSALQLEQVFVNLFTNARDAMRASPTKVLTIVTDVLNDLVRIAVTDTAAGIPAETVPKILDPFFTTKQVGKGTGLGLSISYSIIKEHGGCLEVASDGLHGTTFIIELPLINTTDVPRP